MRKYVHGYSEREAERLGDQSSILEQILHTGTAYPRGARVLEAGCGVGGQTEILARRSPNAEFTSVDISPESLERAAGRVKSLGLRNVRFQQADIYHLPFKDESFDHVFVCFVLEHLDEPLKALAELKRTLKTGGSITVIEGDHGSCFWHRETADSLRVWRCLIDVQQRLGHDPLIGRQLYPLLKNAGFKIKIVEPRWLYADAANPRLLDGMVNKIIVPMVETSKQESLKLGLAEEATWTRGIRELSASGDPPDGTFFYTWFKGVATK